MGDLFLLFYVFINTYLFNPLFLLAWIHKNLFSTFGYNSLLLHLFHSLNYPSIGYYIPLIFLSSSLPSTINFLGLQNN